MKTAGDPEAANRMRHIDAWPLYAKKIFTSIDLGQEAAKISPCLDECCCQPTPAARRSYGDPAEGNAAGGVARHHPLIQWAQATGGCLPPHICACSIQKRKRQIMNKPTNLQPSLGV